jgi:hypothetical protein
VQSGVFNAAEEDAAILEGLGEDGKAVEVEEEGSRLVALISARIGPSKSSVDVAGVEDFVPALPESPRDLPNPPDQLRCLETG